MTREQPPGRATALEDRARNLLQRMANGDDSALAALYQEWSDRVHTLAFWILRDADEAEDVVEETFWQAWKNASYYEKQRGGGPAWLMMIARSRAIDRLRHRRRRANWIADPTTVQTLLDGTSGQRSDAPD